MSEMTATFMVVGSPPNIVLSNEFGFGRGSVIERLRPGRVGLGVAGGLSGCASARSRSGPPVLDPPPQPGDRRPGSAHELDRAGDYRSWGRLIGLASLVVQFATLAFLAFWRGAPMRRRLLGWFGRRRCLTRWPPAPGFPLFWRLTGLPFDVAAWQLGRDYGLVNQTLGDRLLDWLLATVVTAIPAALGGLLAMALLG